MVVRCILLIITTFITVSVFADQICRPDHNDTEPLVCKQSTKSNLGWGGKHVNYTFNWATLTHSNNNRVSDDNVVDSLAYNKNNAFNVDGGETRTETENEILRKLGSRYLNSEPPITINQINDVSPQCLKHSAMYLESLKNLDLWALEMHDATAKIPPGLLNGNTNQFGDFDQCMNAVEPNREFRGKYCLTHTQIGNVPDFPRIKRIRELIQSKNPFRSDFEDTGHRVPRFSIMNWGICIPSTCTAKELEITLRSVLGNFTSGTGVEFRVRVDPDLCQVLEHKPYEINTIYAAIFFVTIILWAIISTVIDYKNEQPNEWLVAFSLRKNLKTMFSLERPANDIGSIHGIRFLNATFLIIGHKSMALCFNPYINRGEMADQLGQYWTVVGRAAAIFTDPFLLFSGLLTSYSMVSRLQKGQPVRIVQEYAGRFLRIVPTFGALILFCTFILPEMSSGPQWNLSVVHHANICKKNWWRNMLFIHNYFGFGDICLTHTHHLGIDTELFLFAPIMVLGLWKWPRKTLYVLIGLAGLSTAARFYSSVVYRLSTYVFYGVSTKELFRTADYLYALPPHRATVYIMGIILGWALQMYKDVKLTKRQLHGGWYIFTALALAAMFGPSPMGKNGYVYNPYHAATYAAFGPIAWCSLAGWVIFTSQNGYHSLVSDFFSWKGFMVTTRLSYAIYLTQFPIFFFNVGRTRHADHYSFISSTSNFNEHIWVYVMSITLTLLFDNPFQSIKQLLFRRKRKSACNIAAPPNVKSLDDKTIVYENEVIKKLND